MPSLKLRCGSTLMFCHSSANWGILSEIKAIALSSNYSSAFTENDLMRLAIVHSRTCSGIEAIAVKVEVFIASGLPRMHIVGLPETVVKESQHRVRAALSHNQFKFPQQRVTVNLSPADLPKEGGRFDLPIALGILAASGQLEHDKLVGYEFLSELSLSGELLSVKGVIPIILAAIKAKRRLIIPHANEREAGLILSAQPQAQIYCAEHLVEVYRWLCEQDKPKPVSRLNEAKTITNAVDMSEVRAQSHAVRALEIAASGRHHCLMMGSPGSGKTMLAQRFPTILPLMDKNEAIETASIMSLGTETLTFNNFYLRPFRSPHHSASAAALLGGGTHPKPGEISKAHNGVLFLDELTEFSRQAIDGLREPIETGSINLARASLSVTYPARFQLIAAMNPCPDGSDIDEYGRCNCSEQRLIHYYRRLSSPMLDRIDLHIRVPRIQWSKLNQETSRGEASAVIQARVLSAWQRQLRRQGKNNAQLQTKEIDYFCKLKQAEQKLLTRFVDKMELSARAYYRILRVARTIADLAASEKIEEPHLLEAIVYRTLDKLLRV